MYKCKQNLNPPIFRNIFTHRTKTKYALRNENSIQEPLCRTNLVSIAFHNVEIVIPSKRLNVNVSDSFYQ